jgi:hypothetical protein
VVILWGYGVSGWFFRLLDRVIKMRVSPEVEVEGVFAYIDYQVIPDAPPKS